MLEYSSMRSHLGLIMNDLTHGAHYNNSLEVGRGLPIDFQVVQGQGGC